MASKIKTLAKSEVKENWLKFIISKGATANCAEVVVKKFSRQPKKPFSFFILKNF